MMINNSDSQISEVFDLFPQMRKEEEKKPRVQKRRTLQRRLAEVILGQRSFLKVYSDALETDLWFVNEGLVNPAEPMFNSKVITMEMLAEIMTTRQPLLHSVEELFRENT
jgi:hypothetical protein